MPNREFQNALFLDGGFGMTLDPTSSYLKGMLGAVVTIKDTDGVAKRGQVVQYHSAQTVAPADGSVCWWVDPAAYTVTVDIGTGLGRGRVAGVIRSAPAVSQGCVVQQGGLCAVLFLDSPTAAPTAAGLIVTPSASSAKADCLAAGSAATYPPLGVSVGTQDGTTKKANVDLQIGPNVP